MLAIVWVWLVKVMNFTGHVEEAVAQVSRANSQQKWKRQVKKCVTSLNKTSRKYNSVVKSAHATPFLPPPDFAEHVRCTLYYIQD